MIIRIKRMKLLRKMTKQNRMTSQVTVMVNNRIRNRSLLKIAKKSRIKKRRYHITHICHQKQWATVHLMACHIFLFKPFIKLAKLAKFKCHSIWFPFLTHIITQPWHSTNSTINSVRCHPWIQYMDTCHTRTSMITIKVLNINQWSILNLVMIKRRRMEHNKEHRPSNQFNTDTFIITISLTCLQRPTMLRCRPCKRTWQAWSTLDKRHELVKQMLSVVCILLGKESRQGV